MVHSFRELITWQLASELETKVLPLLALDVVKKDRRFLDQLSDASKSPARNIAEGFGKQRALDHVVQRREVVHA